MKAGIYEYYRRSKFKANMGSVRLSRLEANYTNTKYKGKLREATEFTSGAGYLRGLVSFHPLTVGPTIFSPLAKGMVTFSKAHFFQNFLAR